MNNQDTSILNIKYAPEMRKLLAQAGGTEPSKEIDKFLNGFERLVNKIIGAADGTYKNLGANGGLRFAIPNEYRQDVMDAIKTYISNYELKVEKIINAGRTGAGKTSIDANLATPRYDYDAKAFSEGTAVFTDMGSVNAYKAKVQELGGTTGRMIHNKKNHTYSVPYSVPNTFDGKEYAAGKLSNFAASLNREEMTEQEKLDAEYTERIQAIREEEVGKERRRRALAKLVPLAWENVKRDMTEKNKAAIEGYKEAKEKKTIEESAEQKEKSIFFKSSLLHMTALVAGVKKIYSVVSKILDAALQAVRGGMQANVDPDYARSLDAVVEVFGGNKGAGMGAANSVYTSLGNVLGINSGMYNTLVPLFLRDTQKGARAVEMMRTLYKTKDTTGTLSAIMDALYERASMGIDSGGSYVGVGGAVADILTQLNTNGYADLASTFGSYVYANQQKQAADLKAGKKFVPIGFEDFGGLLKYTNTKEAADIATNKNAWEAVGGMYGTNVTQGVLDKIFSGGLDAKNLYPKEEVYKEKNLVSELQKHLKAFTNNDDISKLLKQTESSDPAKRESAYRSLAKKLGEFAVPERQLTAEESEAQLKGLKTISNILNGAVEPVEKPSGAALDVLKSVGDGTFTSYLGPEGASFGGTIYNDNTTTNYNGAGEGLPPTKMVLEIRSKGDIIGGGEVEIGQINYYSAPIYKG